jgi:hypothetical protein
MSSEADDRDGSPGKPHSDFVGELPARRGFSFRGYPLYSKTASIFENKGVMEAIFDS